VLKLLFVSNLKNMFLYVYLCACVILSFDLYLVDFSCDFANGFLRFVIINDLLSFLCITNLGRLFRFPETLSLKEVLIFSCMDRRAKLRFELL